MNLQIRPDEISDILKDQILDSKREIDVYETGTVLQVGDGVARVHGLANVMASELVAFPHDIMGMALNLEEDNVGCVLFGEDTHINEGDPVRRTGAVVDVPVGEGLLGRVVDPLGRPLDGKGEIVSEARMPVERKALGVVERAPVRQPLMTGLKIVDSITPIGRGQRELIIGDRQTGKTAIGVDAIINQKQTHQTDRPVFCIYVAIGQKASTVAKVAATLEAHGAMDYTVIVSAPASEPAPLQYLAPYSGCTIGEYFRDKGQDALAVYDDLSKHSWVYRQMSLVLRRPPGREAYPGDVFYLHSRLLERSSMLSEDLGGGSLTALPIIETLEGDLSTYIPTNVWSITDGQIRLLSELFYAGTRPAMDVGNSVSRVGSSAQSAAIKNVSRTLKIDLARYRDVQAFAQFGSDLDAATQQLLNRGTKLTEILKQPQYQPMSTEKQVAVVYMATNGFLDEIPVDAVGRYEQEFLESLDSENADLMLELAQKLDLTEEMEERLRSACETFTQRFKAALEQQTAG
ncbi:MAG: F0F1 ATP synthase subunit alpha [Candidatus Latescibacteria bacterium]|nr:F0F1 ATP synthase subunit alpha [Candidatus Latescibacterota bacterium]